MMVGKIPEQVISEIIKRTDLVAVASRVAGLKFRERRRGDFWACCPFHAEKTPSFHIEQRKGTYHCFGCSAGGSAFQFLMSIDNISFKEAAIELAALAGIEIEGETSKPRRKPQPMVVDQKAVVASEAASAEAARRKAFDKWWRPRKPFAGSLAETYLVNVRGIAGDVARSFKNLGYLDDAPFYAQLSRGRFDVVNRGPAMVAGLQYADGRFAGVHVTFLKADGSGKLELHDPMNAGKKLPAKKVQGRPWGSAIRLTDTAPRMVAGEGIETTAAVIDATGYAGWVAYSLGNLVGAANGKGARHPENGRTRLPSTTPDMGRHGFLPPKQCEHLTLLGDGDTKDVWMLRALLKRGCLRFQMLGVKTDYSMSDSGRDFNDYLMKEQAHG